MKKFGLQQAFATDRRSFLAGAAAMTMTLAFPARAADASKIVGFLASGPWNDFGYTQSHFDAMQELAEMPGVKILREEGVPETADVQRSIRSMIELDGAEIIVGTSYGYLDPHMVEMAKAYPDVLFLHCGGFWTDGMPSNLVTFFAFSEEVSYITGVVAGEMAGDGVIGYVASKPIGLVLSPVNAFTLGARSVNPDVKVQLIMTGEWSDPVKEANATNTLVDQGVSVIACDVDAPRVVIDTCEQRGVPCIGRHANLSSLAPTMFLTGSEWRWSSFYMDAVHGEPMAGNVRGGLAEELVRTSPYGAACSEAAKAAADAARSKILAGALDIFAGPIFDNKGAERIPAGTTIAVNDPQLETVDWLVDGVIGSAT